MTYLPIKPSSRTGKYGRIIKCPNCGELHSVGHFSWYSLVCTGCNKSVNKLYYLMQSL